MSESDAETGRAGGREAMKATVRALIERDCSYDETRAMIEETFPEISPQDMASIVKEIGDEIRAKIASQEKVTDTLLDEIRETKKRSRDMDERIDVAERPDEDETQ